MSRTKNRKIKTRTTWFSRWQENRAERTTVAPWNGPVAPSSGHIGYVPDLNEWLGTTRHTCGQWPFGLGTEAPIHGAQLGVHYYTREPIGCDPLTWFEKGYIFNPSMFFLSNPAVGKSTTLRKMMIGCQAGGTNVIVAGDRKAEHVDLIKRLGGQVYSLGPGRGVLNILDPGEVLSAVERINRECEDKDTAESITAALIGDMHAKRLSLTTALISMYRRTSQDVSGHEASILDEALRWLHKNHEGTPVLSDLLNVIHDAPESVRRVANDYGDMARYREVTRALENDLTGLTSGGGMGEMFNGQSTATVSRDRSVVYEIRGIDEQDKAILSAAYIASWASAFGMVNVAHALADAGLEPNRQYLVVMDECWQPLSASPGMVDRMNAATRLNRDKGVATLYASHTMSDLQAISSEEDRNKARGIVSRCGAVILGGLDREELEERVSRVTKLKAEEIELLVSWNAPPPLGDRGTMPGRGKFLIKIGEAPGIPVDVLLTDAERAAGIHDTNKRMRKEVGNA